MSGRVARTIRRRALFDKGDRVALAVSGGADSVAMAWLLRDLDAGASWRLAGLVHVNHGLRGAESDDDEAFCRELARRLDLPIDVARADVHAFAASGARRRRSVEVAAREARYAAFGSAARALGASKVATAHTLDDQAETVLLRLLRGAGSRGIAAIRPRRGLYVRPLIDCRRADLRAYLAACGEPFREDSSNLDLSIPRNRLRHTLMPVIAADWPGAARALARLAELAGDDERFLAATAAEVTSAVTLVRGNDVEFDVRGIGELPPALSRRIVRTALETAGGAAAFGDIEAVLRLARSSRTRGRLDLHQVTVERRGAGLRIAARAAHEEADGFEYALPVPGKVWVPETGCTIQASLQEGSDPPARLLHDRNTVVLPALAAREGLTVRNRRPGDRIRLFGAAGRRKLQDVFVDRKIPRNERDRVPIVVDAAGRILWVAGVAAAEECRVSGAESGVVILELKKGNL